MNSKPFCIMKIQHYQLKDGTKTVYELLEEDRWEIDEKEYRRVITSSPFFRRLGGSEYHHKSYTCRGYLTYKLVSKSSCRTMKTVREFDFDL